MPIFYAPCDATSGRLPCLLTVSDYSLSNRIVMQAATQRLRGGRRDVNAAVCDTSYSATQRVIVVDLPVATPQQPGAVLTRSAI